MSAPGFHGAKLALFNAGRVLVYLRDDRADIPWPNHWDLPGGGREGAESPADCAMRELYEEFGLRLPKDRLTYARLYAGVGRDGRDAWFFSGDITNEEIAAIRFGHEGQRWLMMEVDDFLTRPDAPGPLKARLRDCLEDRI